MTSSPCSFVTKQVRISSPSYDSYYTQKHRVQHPMSVVKISPSRLRYGSSPSPIRCSRSQIPHPIIHEEPPKQTTQGDLLFDMKFSLDVAKHVILENLRKNKSTAFSPTSVDTVLRILATGAQNTTLKQFLYLLGHNDVRELNAAATKLSDILKTSDIDEKEKVLEISNVNALWLDQNYSFKDGFKKVLSEVYDAQTRVGDFENKVDEVVAEANSWANEVTKGMIPQILTRDVIVKDTMLLLANALYFKGTWENAFKSRNTKDRTFNLLDGDEVQVPFMHQGGNDFEFGDFNTCKVIRMPYKGGNSSKYLSMYALLPHEKDGLPNLVEEIKINENMFNDQFKLEKVEVDLLCIPKFKVESEVSLKKTMKQLGLISPFDPFCEDFTEMVNESATPLFVTEIMQRCFVETNEEGTRAAAVTSVMICGCAWRPPRPPIEFVADHPFMFIIREDISGAILFVGTMLNPKQT